MPNTNLVLTSNTGTMTGGQYGIIANSAERHNGVAELSAARPPTSASCRSRPAASTSPIWHQFRARNMAYRQRRRRVELDPDQCGHDHLRPAVPLSSTAATTRSNCKRARPSPELVSAGNGGTNNVLRLGGTRTPVSTSATSIPAALRSISAVRHLSEERHQQLDADRHRCADLGGERRHADRHDDQFVGQQGDEQRRELRVRPGRTAPIRVSSPGQAT